MGVSASEAAEEMRLGALVRLLVLSVTGALGKCLIDHFPVFRKRIDHLWSVFQGFPKNGLSKSKKSSVVVFRFSGQI